MSETREEAKTAWQALDLASNCRAERAERERDQIQEDLVQMFAVQTVAQKWDAITRAAREGRISCAVLLGTMTDVQKRDALVRAAQRREVALLKRALEAGVDPNAVGSAALEEFGLASVTAL